MKKFEDLTMNFDDWCKKWNDLKNNLGCDSKDIKVLKYKVQFLDKHGWGTTYVSEIKIKGGRK